MEFRKEVRSTEILSPLIQFESEVQSIEYREDPLTGSQCRINVARAGRVRQVQQAGVEVREVIERTASGCSFCPQNISQRTPKFPPILLPEGRIKRGEC